MLMSKVDDYIYVWNTLYFVDGFFMMIVYMILAQGALVRVGLRSLCFAEGGVATA